MTATEVSVKEPASRGTNLGVGCRGHAAEANRLRGGLRQLCREDGDVRSLFGDIWRPVEHQCRNQRTMLRTSSESGIGQPRSLAGAFSWAWSEVTNALDFKGSPHRNLGRIVARRCLENKCRGAYVLGAGDAPSSP